MLFRSCEIPLPPTAAESQKFSERIKDLSNVGDRTFFAIETLDGTIVGRTNILQDDHIHGTFEIATTIDREYRGKGYGTASMKIMLNYAFMERRLNKYCASIMEGNAGSIGMHEKLGCVQEGFCKENIYTNGKYYAEIWYGLTKTMYLNGGDCKND